MNAAPDVTEARHPWRAALRFGVVVASGVVAATLAAHSADCLLGVSGVRDARLGVLLHATAASLASAAGEVSGRVRPGDRPALLAIAFALPLFGPALAWALLLRPREPAIVDAHQAFEEARRSTAGSRDFDAAHYRRPVVAYARIAERGSFEERRNLLRQLGRLGEPKHLQVLRDFLRDDDTELRLCAYAELTRIGERYERTIATRRVAAERLAEDPDRDDDALATLRAELAEASLAYGQSGALEREMAEYWLHQAAVQAEQVLDVDPLHPRGLTLRARALAGLGDLETAWHDVESLAAIDDGPSTATLAAGIAFRRGDYRSVRRALAALRRHGAEIPGWLAATEEMVHS